jgi:hypothetical protein
LPSYDLSIGTVMKLAQEGVVVGRRRAKPRHMTGRVISNRPASSIYASWDYVTQLLLAWQQCVPKCLIGAEVS